MDKSIERAFFKAFQQGGVFEVCSGWIQSEYKLNYSYTTDNMHPEVARMHNEIHPQFIKEETALFDSSVIEYLDSPLMDEIESNINECRTEQDRVRYIYSLLAPFKIYSDKFIPLRVVKQLQNRKEECSKAIEYWTKNAAWRKDAEEQIGANEESITNSDRDIERTTYISEQLRVLAHKTCDTNSIESYFNAFVDIIYKYANRLDALLLTYGIDLLKIQDECHIYILEQRDVFVLSQYIGSMELAQKYVSKMPTKQLILPNAIDTPLAQKIFPRAIEAGYMKQTDFGCKWDTNKNSVSLLAYMLDMVYSGNFRETELNVYFGVKKLSKTLNQILNNKGNAEKGRPAGRPVGFEKIDDLFYDVYE